MRLAFVLPALILLAPCLGLAEPDARADREIRHLLDFVAASSCTFIRNGDPHAAKDAADHLAMKYERARSRLQSAEQFIDKVASQSYLTGRQYRVQCPGQVEMATAEWLGAELLALRKAQQDDPGVP